MKPSDNLRDWIFSSTGLDICDAILLSTEFLADQIYISVADVLYCNGSNLDSANRMLVRAVFEQVIRDLVWERNAGLPSDRFIDDYDVVTEAYKGRGPALRVLRRWLKESGKTNTIRELDEIIHALRFRL